MLENRNQDSIQMTIKIPIPKLFILIAFFTIFDEIDARKLIAIKHGEAYVPYGVYVIRNKWGCNMKDPRCNSHLSLIEKDENEDPTADIPHMPEVTLGRDLQSSWEIIPYDNGLYQIVSKQGCETDPEEFYCNVPLSHRNGFAVLDEDYPALWRIVKDKRSGFWLILGDSQSGQDRTLSFNSELNEPTIELLPNDDVIWELLIDITYLESQSMENVEFDLDGKEVLETKPTVVASDEVHNLGEQEVVNKFGMKYPVKESFQFTDWDGFVLPIDTSMLLRKPIFDGIKLQLSEEISFITKWRKTMSKISEAILNEQVSVPAAAYKMVEVLGTEANFSVPFNAILKQTFSTGKFSRQRVRGMYYATQVYGIQVSIGDAKPLNGNDTTESWEQTWIGNSTEDQTFEHELSFGFEIRPVIETEIETYNSSFNYNYTNF